MSMVLSTASCECLSYIAHGKRLPAQISDPKCKLPERADDTLCDHIQTYLSSGGDGTLSSMDRKSLTEVGYFKKQICKSGQLRAEQRLLSYGTSFSPGYRIRPTNDWEGSCALFWNGPLEIYTSHNREVELRNSLDLLDRDRDRELQISDTGTLTVLKLLNDLEMKLLKRIVERDAPECLEEVKKFSHDTRFSYCKIRNAHGARSLDYRACCNSPVFPTTGQLQTQWATNQRAMASFDTYHTLQR